jgi:23S rRNA (cytosine1962-C5)-methyltransferase
MVLAEDWREYKILATGDGRKLESWAGIKLLRPDPQIIWEAEYDFEKEPDLAAKYVRSSSGGGAWEILQSVPDEFQVNYKDLSFSLKLMGFKHTGLFPEQAANWDVMRGIIASKKHEYREPVRVLNLFAYTGGATVALAKDGAKVTHVDASKGMVERAKQNCALSGVGDTSVRWIVDDCKKFLEREKRRNSVYEAVIMDPPSYGRSPAGDVWKLEEALSGLVSLSVGVLSRKPLFVLLNGYTTGLGASVMQNVLSKALKGRGGTVESYELCLPTNEENIVLPCGSSALWKAQ